MTNKDKVRRICELIFVEYQEYQDALCKESSDMQRAVEHFFTDCYGILFENASLKVAEVPVPKSKSVLHHVLKVLDVVFMDKIYRENTHSKQFRGILRNPHFRILVETVRRNGLSTQYSEFFVSRYVSILGVSVAANKQIKTSANRVFYCVVLLGLFLPPLLIKSAYISWGVCLLNFIIVYFFTSKLELFFWRFFFYVFYVFLLIRLGWSSSDK